MGKNKVSSWGRENPQLVVVMALVLLGYIVVLLQGDKTITMAIITGVFGYLTGVETKRNPDEESGGDLCEWLGDNGYCNKQK